MSFDNDQQQQFEDKYLVCKDNKHVGDDRNFVWTKGEQKFMHQLKAEGKLEGEITEPKRCAACRRLKKARFEQRERDRQR